MTTNEVCGIAEKLHYATFRILPVRYGADKGIWHLLPQLGLAFPLLWPGMTIRKTGYSCRTVDLAAIVIERSG